MIKENSLVIRNCLPVGGEHLRNCFSKKYLLRDYTGPGAEDTTENTKESSCYRADLPKIVTYLLFIERSELQRAEATEHPLQNKRIHDQS